MDIWLFLFTLVSMFLGWVLGRWVFPRKLVSKDDRVVNWPISYIKGLNYLLTDNSDKAILAFTELAQVDPDTIEIHIALGHLFRTKGEVNRAIKIHQTLLARPGLTRSQRQMVIGELAYDYLKAGLHDRAENLYLELTQFKHSYLIAYQRLFDLYTAEKSWHKASECAQKLYAQGAPNAAVILSQCHCEIACLALGRGNKKLAGKRLNAALSIDHDCVRAGLLLIELHVSMDNYSLAKQQLQRLINRNREYIMLYIEPAKLIYLQDNKPDRYQDFLLHEYEINPSNQLAIALLEHYAQSQQLDKAKVFLKKVLQHLPSFDTFDFALRFLKSEPGQSLDINDSLSDFLKAMQRKRIQYMCAHCGYGSHHIEWHCPSCHHWSTMKAV